MKLLKKAFLALFAVCVLAVCTVMCAANVSAARLAASGNCGDNLTWNLYDDGELIISGSGPMWNWDSTYAPWSKHITSTLPDVTSVTIGNGVTTIGTAAFVGCDKLTDVSIGNKVWLIGTRAFAACNSLTSITFPDSVSTIGDRVFYNCRNLKTISISKGVTAIGDSVFYNCTNLESISVDAQNPAYVDVDGVLFDKAKTKLIHYPGLKTDRSYTIPDSVLSIEDFAFAYCQNLNEVTISKNVNSIGFMVFAGNTNFTSFTVVEDNTSYASEDGVLFNKAKTELLQYPVGKTDTSYTIPNGVTVIASYSFAVNTLENIILPETLISIAPSAFEYSFALKSITIPENVAVIGDGAFLFSKNLKEVTVLSRTVVYNEPYTSIFYGAHANLTLKGYKGSTTQAYATEKGYRFVDIEVVPGDYTLGDINGDTSVDINDAIALFRYSMMPALYPISYAGSTDFTKDGSIDINDAILLFRHSMMPDLYPIT